MSIPIMAMLVGGAIWVAVVLSGSITTKAYHYGLRHARVLIYFGVLIYILDIALTLLAR